MKKEQDETFRKFREAEILAGQNVASENLMTEQEIHEFGVDTIYNYAKQEGYEIIDGSTNLNQNPQLVIRKEGQLYLVIVKTGPGDGTHLTYNKDIYIKVINTAKTHNAKVLFAGVGLYCVGFGYTLVRNQGYKVDFRGFENIEFV